MLTLTEAFLPICRLLQMPLLRTFVGLVTIGHLRDFIQLIRQHLLGSIKDSDAKYGHQTNHYKSDGRIYARTQLRPISI